MDLLLYMLPNGIELILIPLELIDMRINKTSLIVIIASLTSLIHLEAKSKFGEQYVSAALSFSESSDTNPDLEANSSAIKYNTNLNTDGVGIDLFVTAALSRLEEPYKSDQAAVLVGLNFYPSTDGKIRPFIGIAAGYLEGDYNVSSFEYAIGFGVEFQVTEDFLITPSISYLDLTEYSNADEVNYSIELSYWVTEQISIGLAYTYTDEDLITLNTYGISALFAF